MLAKTSIFFLPLATTMVSAALLPHWLKMNRRADICGVSGHDRNRGNYFWSASKKLASFSGCSARCAKSDRCQSFGFSAEVCMLFDLSLAENFDEDRKSDVEYFDVGCIQEEPSSSTAGDVTSSLTITTTVSTATRTITRSIALATGTGAPCPPINSTGFYPVHRNATANRFPQAPSSTSSKETVAPMLITSNDPADESPASDIDGAGNNEQSSDFPHAPPSDTFLAPAGNTTFANVDTRASPNNFFIFERTNVE